MKTVSVGGSFSKSEIINLMISSGLSQFGLVDLKFFRDYKPRACGSKHSSYTQQGGSNKVPAFLHLNLFWDYNDIWASAALIY